MLFLHFTTRFFPSEVYSIYKVSCFPRRSCSTTVRSLTRRTKKSRRHSILLLKTEDWRLCRSWSGGNGRSSMMTTRTPTPLCISRLWVGGRTSWGSSFDWVPTLAPGTAFRLALGSDRYVVIQSPNQSVRFVFTKVFMVLTRLVQFWWQSFYNSWPENFVLDCSLF